MLLLVASQASVPAQKERTAHNLQPLDINSLKARSIGPAVMGGRVSTIALDPEDPYTFYVGLGTGGVMKTSTNGANFDAIFEKESVAAVGAIAISPSNPRIVWVGTGEANDRNSSSWGNGVYLSYDGGGTWRNIGLKESKTIARIAVHPSDTNTAWIAVSGDLWIPNAERGLFKTTNAGKSWKKVLAATSHQENVGCGDVAIDPADPMILYAALYARQRKPWAFVSGPDATDGKDVGGIFKSTDGGDTWRKLSKGLPGKTHRIGLDIYRKNSKILYAVIESSEGGTSSIDEPKSKRGGVFRSEDGGESWARMNALNPRPFYFSQIRVDPSNERRVYVLGYMLHVSEDGGTSFREDYFEKVHPDCHAFVFDWRNPKRVLLGTDGGVYQSFSGGKGWDHLSKFAAGEFYRITLDNSTPYRIAGGLQDNLN
ncbi:MAG TPA: glycosyl hydrolase, partial [Bacteroidota bacterium]|nr:glycosyl hydrolase [Bacteroidota bacterium]